jgi:hypothetical protein
MNDEILVQFVCLHVHGGVVDLVRRGGFRLIKTFPMEGQSRYSIFLLAMNLFDWSIITLPKKKKNILSLVDS